MPISLLNYGGSVGGVVQAIAGSFFANTAKTKKLEIQGADKVELIPGDNTQKASPRKWSIFNQGLGTVFLFYGNEKEHGHPLPPGFVFTSDDAGGLGNRISALSDSKALVRVTIRGTVEETEGEMPPPLKVKPFAPTGTNRPEKVTDSLRDIGLPLEDVTVVGQDQIDGILDSDDGHVGFKFFQLASFEPGQPYTFSIKISEDFKKSYLSDYLELPVKCWALNPLKALELRLQIIYNQISPAKINILNQAWRVKEWIGVKVDELPAEFVVVPDYATMFFGFWSVDSRTGYENALVWEFDPEKNEFSILGF